jgi:hypothetical protein
MVRSYLIPSAGSRLFIQRLAATACLALTLGASQVRGQAVPDLATTYRAQLRRAVELESQFRPPVTLPLPAPRDSQHNKVWIGAVVGGVALPAILYLLLHSSDSGRFNPGTALPIAAVGAFLGVMVALSTGGK